MKTFFLLLFAMFITVGVCACDEGNEADDLSQKIKVDILRAFDQRFPQAQDVDWDKEGKYFVAEFKSPVGSEVIGPAANPMVLYEMEAWFDHGGNWRMTVMEVIYDMLPHSVQVGFSSCSYSGWKVEECNVVEGNGQDTLYILEVQNGSEERELYFNPQGKLTMEKKHSSDDYGDLIK